MELCTVVGTFVVFVVYSTLFLLNNTVHFYTKLFIHYINLLLASLLPIPFALFRPKDVRNTNYSSFVLKHASKLFNITVDVKGVEHVSGQDAVVVICNHQSSLDVLTMMELWPQMHRCAPIIKQELLYAGPFGLDAWLSGAVFVDRSNPTKARQSMNNALSYLTEKKIKLWVFPEGTRNDTGTMLPFKKGAFHMAVQAQVPIVPMVISSYASFYDQRKKKFDNGGKIKVVVMPPVPTKGLKTEDIDNLAVKMRQQMLDKYYEISDLKPPKSNGENCKDKTTTSSDSNEASDPKNETVNDDPKKDTLNDDPKTETLNNDRKKETLNDDPKKETLNDDPKKETLNDDPRKETVNDDPKKETE